MHRTAGAFCSSWRYRFLNFTHIAPRTIGLLLLSVVSRCLHILSLSLPITLFRSFAHVLTSLSEEPPIVLYSETSFCFILPFSPLSRSVSVRLIIYIYICMHFRAFHLYALIVRTGKLRTRFAASVVEKGAKRVE